jgi:DNA mismatch repair protein MutS
VAKKIAETPMMKQYVEIKKKHPDAVLLFRVGDFYETFSDDAIEASEILGITLTRRANGAAQFVELAGFPHHALDTYLPKLIRAGKRVAICDQLEDPKKTKKLVKRGITELVTPGVSINDNILNHKENNFLCSIHIAKSNYFGISFLDISTGEFLTSEGSSDMIDKWLSNFAPKEILIEQGNKRKFQEKFGSSWLVSELDDWIYTESAANDKLLKHFKTANLKGFGVDNLHEGIIASGAILYYLDITKHSHIDHINSISKIEEDRYVRLDRFTIRNLELISSINEGGKSLLDILDKTISPMGARLMRRWLIFPLKELEPIEERLNVVEYFFIDPELKKVLSQQLSMIGDLERIASKVATGRVTAREIVQLKVSLIAIEAVKEALRGTDFSMRKLANSLDPCSVIRDRIEKEIVPDPPALLNKGGFVKKGVNEELDELREIAYSSKDYLMKMQQRESELTGIPSLKIAFNNVFGYYIEVRNTHKDKVPADWIRKQTLVSAERYITDELKKYEEKILGAEEKISILENDIYQALVNAIIEYIPVIQKNASTIAKIDCLLSFATVAEENRYIRPQVDDSDVIDISQGRHPVIEKQLPAGVPYIANDVYLDNEKQQILMITGPNMSGKSALLRQTALITLMAQVGCFVPADSARIGLVDKIFTRVGASDNISLGESTFMVEMNEAANILNNISSRSLVLFDELGRGTSTYDGISIAWAIVEYIHENLNARAKTLFATHYHELNEMEKTFKRIKNYNVSVKEIDNNVIFMRKLERGGSEHSFGIHVAKMAGMPQSITNRAETILEQMEKSNRKGGMKKPIEDFVEKQEGYQLSFFQLDDPVLSQIRDEILNTNVNNLTPIEALNKLNEIKKIIKGK